MTKFDIIQADNPMSYASQIYYFWDNYLSGTPKSRLEWMLHGNPAGPATWFLAFEKDSRALAGMMSVMPRDIFVQKRALKAGIVGDFIIDEKHRVFGPSIQLPKMLKENYFKFGFDLLYTVPNIDSVKIMNHFGFKSLKKLCNYTRPITFSTYLERYMRASAAKILSLTIESILKPVSWMSCVADQGVFDYVTNVDDTFDEFFESLRRSSREPVADRCSSYLRWRYLRNPMFSFKILKYKKTSYSKLAGFLVFAIVNNVMEIFDCAGLKIKDRCILLRKAIQIAMSQRCRSIKIVASRSGEWPRHLKKNGFFDNKDMIEALCLGHFQDFENWDFVSGDRNI